MNAKGFFFCFVLVLVSFVQLINGVTERNHTSGLPTFIQ